MKKITLNRRVFIKSILIFFFNKLTFSKSKNSIPEKLTIIFGSCSNQKKEMKHWKEIITYNPNYIFLLGDNVYGDFYEKNAKELKEVIKDIEVDMKQLETDVDKQIKKALNNPLSKM